jgi:hypothetical protein
MRKKQAKLIKDVFPNIVYVVYGGVNFEPYKNRFMNWWVKMCLA